MTKITIPQTLDPIRIFYPGDEHYPSNIKVCPCCKGQANLSITRQGGTGEMSIMCDVCELIMSRGYYAEDIDRYDFKRVLKFLIAAWNRRDGIADPTAKKPRPRKGGELK